MEFANSGKEGEISLWGTRREPTHALAGLKPAPGNTQLTFLFFQLLSEVPDPIQDQFLTDSCQTPAILQQVLFS